LITKYILLLQTYQKPCKIGYDTIHNNQTHMQGMYPLYYYAEGTISPSLPLVVVRTP